LNTEGFKTLAIHGDKSQNERDSTLESFKRSEVRILVATDVASRGLDVRDITVVINYDMPKLIEDYIHRIGRTGRAGAFGDSYSFMTEDDRKLVRELIQVMEETNQEVNEDL